MSSTNAFRNTITDRGALREIYRMPAAGAVDKETAALDVGCRDFIAASSFVLVGTSDGADGVDVSPRGGPTGFVKVLDDHRLAIPDLSGNNRLDSIENLIDHAAVGLLFVIPGMDETLRVNGTGCITVDDAVLDLFVDDLRRPKTAIGVTVDTAFIHCAKSFRRGNMWRPDEWIPDDTRPSAAAILRDHAEAQDVITTNELHDALEASYAEDLDADRPGPR